ncbi:MULTISPECIES: ROK family transcriptional regulator [Hungatella]|nr:MULTISPECIES: ROK family transcriptional regulator [Hungatella]
MMTARGTNLPRVKKQNEALIKEIIYKYGPISRSKIAEMLSLTPPTITTNVSSLIERGLVYEFAAEDSDVEERSLGRKPIKINFIQDARYAIGVEMNPYQMAICMLDLRGNEKISMKYPPMNGVYVEEMDMLARNIDKLISESGVDPEKILGVGMGLPGFVESKVGILRESFKTGWNNKNIARDLSRRLDIPVLIENNARARAIGEEMFGKTLRPDSFAYYLISYGIACPLFVKNRMITGENASAGEAGHMVVDINGPKCETCGHNGCLEEMASERAILKKCKAAVNDGVATMLTELCPDTEELTMKDVLMAEECNDAYVVKVMEEAVMYLGVTLANIINLISPPLVIVDGYIMKVKRNRRQLLEETKKHIFGLNDQEIEIEFIDFNPLTGARGGAALAIKQFFIKE